jgi:hypothetical protein
MGCYSAKKIASSIIISNMRKSEPELHSVMEMKRDYFYAITKNCWVNIVDFLPSKDLSETLKINR